MQIINLMPASAASNIESLQNFAGTKIIEAFGSRELLASSTELKTGFPRCSIPPLPGVTPPTIFVPYSMDCSECNAVSYTHLRAHRDMRRSRMPSSA